MENFIHISIFSQLLDLSLTYKIVLAILGYFIISIFLLFIIIFINRVRMKKKAKRTENIREAYRDQLMEYVFDENADSVLFFPIRDNIRRSIFIEELLSFCSNFSGDSADKLREMYFSLNLDEDSLARASAKKWHHKAKGFNELSQMNVKEAIPIIEKYITDKNPILRVEAKIALIRLSDENPLGFLDDYKENLSQWEIINIHNTLVGNEIEIESFERWLDSKNLSVKIFALQMIALYKHVQSTSRVIELLKHKDSHIRYNAVNTLKQLQSEDSKVYLKAMFNAESLYLKQAIAKDKLAKKSRKKYSFSSLTDTKHIQNKLAIIDALEPLADSGDIDFFREIYTNWNHNYSLKLGASKVLHDIDEDFVLMEKNKLE